MKMHFMQRLYTFRSSYLNSAVNICATERSQIQCENNAPVSLVDGVSLNDLCSSNSDADDIKKSWELSTKLDKLDIVPVDEY